MQCLIVEAEISYVAIFSFYFVLAMLCCSSTMRVLMLTLIVQLLCVCQNVTCFCHL